MRHRTRNDSDPTAAALASEGKAGAPIAASDAVARHLLRRAGFGASSAERAGAAGRSFDEMLDSLVDYEQVPDDVDQSIGQPGYAGVKATTSAPFSPNTVIGDAQQRWLFRMVHGRRPLQEKMALFWHNHFATSYTKIAGIFGNTEATRMMAAKPAEDPGGAKGQLELLRELATGSFGDLALAIARDPAMLVWLDGRSNVKSKPQENFGRELMEIFTMGVGFYKEPDVYAAARVFTGWNLQHTGASGDPAGRYEFVYNASQHETSAKTFSFPVYPDGTQTIPARSAADGQQDGIDLIAGLARHPETGRRLARQLYAFFVNDTSDPDASLVAELASVYATNGLRIKPVLRYLFTSPQFTDGANWFARYSWPVEFVVRAIKETGWAGFPLADALTPLSQMGQQLLEPPDVSGWRTGRGWFASGPMLARMNFAAQLARNQRAGLAQAAAGNADAPASLLRFMTDQFTAMHFEARDYDQLLAYLQAGAAWSGSSSQLQVKAAGLAHLILGSSEYQFL